MNKKWNIVLGILLLVIILYWTRYQIVETHTGNMPSCYKINRLTGKITWIANNQSRTVKKEELQSKHAGGIDKTHQK